MKTLRMIRASGTPALIALLLTVTLLAGCDRNVTNMLPHDVEGIYITDDPRYKDRFFELSPTFLIIVAGHDAPASVQWIDKVKVQPEASGTSYLVYSTDYAANSQNQMALVFSPEHGGEIRFRNQPQVWRRYYR